MKQKGQKKTTSIKTKLLGTLLPVVIVIGIVLVGMSYFVSKQIITEYATDLLNSSIENQANEIESWLGENLAAFQMAKETIEGLDADDAQLQDILDRYYGYDDDYPNGLYIADADGKLMKAGGSDKTESNPTDSVWYKDGLTRLNMAFTDAYTNADEEAVISASGILNDGSAAMKVISVDLSLQRISIIVNSFVQMDDAQAILVDTKDGTILAARDSSLIFSKLSGSDDSFYKRIEEKRVSGDYVMEEIDNRMAACAEVSGTDWLLVSYVPIATVYSGLNTVRMVMALIGIISLLILAVIIERTVHVVIKPVKELTSVITAMTDGDFTVSVDVKSDDEIGVMSQCVQHFIQSMRGMILSIHGVSDKLHEQADNSSLISGQMYDASRTQSQSMQELNNTVEQLSLSVNEIAENATTLAMVVSDTREEGSQVDLKMKDTVEVSRKGKADMQNVGDAMQNINQSVLKLQQAIDKVGKASEEITNITGVISGIAEETNLLSLNASIEAARAGEAGKGFAVVADEVRNLAGKVAQAASDTTELISDSIKAVEDGTAIANETAQTLSLIVETTTQTTALIADISTACEEQANAISQISTGVDQISSVVQTNSATSEECAASAEELSSQASILDGMVSKFKLDNNVLNNKVDAETPAPDIASEAKPIITDLGEKEKAKADIGKHNEKTATGIKTNKEPIRKDKTAELSSVQIKPVESEKPAVPEKKSKNDENVKTSVKENRIKSAAAKPAVSEKKTKNDENAKTSVKENRIKSADTKPVDKPANSSIKPIAADFTAEKKTQTKQQDKPAENKKLKASDITHFDTAVQTNVEFKEDVNDKY